MFRRYQVRVRRSEELHTFAVRINAMRGNPPDPKAASYRIALNLLVMQGQIGGPRSRPGSKAAALAEPR